MIAQLLQCLYCAQCLRSSSARDRLLLLRRKPTVQMLLEIRQLNECGDDMLGRQEPGIEPIGSPDYELIRDCRELEEPLVATVFLVFRRVRLSPFRDRNLVLLVEDGLRISSASSSFLCLEAPESNGSITCF